MMTAGGLVALTDSARAIAVFPKPGGAGHAPTLADLAGDGATQHRRGLGRGLAALRLRRGRRQLVRRRRRPGRRRAATSRARAAGCTCRRTRSRPRRCATWRRPARRTAGCGSPGPRRATTARPGGPRPTSCASRRWPPRRRARAGTLATGLPAPDSAGTAQGVTLAAGEPGVTRWYWLFALGRGGQPRARSRTSCAFTPPRAARPADRLAVGERPSWVPVRLDWAGAGAECIRIYDVTGRSVRAPAARRGLERERAMGRPGRRGESRPGRSLFRAPDGWFPPRSNAHRAPSLKHGGAAATGP